MSAVDAAQLDLMFTELRMPSAKAVWKQLAGRADKEGWPTPRLLAALAEQEIADRARRRFERHLAEARLPPGKTLDNFEFDLVPMVSKAHVNALAAGDRWLDQGANLILIGNPGGGKSHLAAAIGLALVENGFRVLYARTTDLVQRLQVARRELTLEAAIRKLDKYHLLILDLCEAAGYVELGRAASVSCGERPIQLHITGGYSRRNHAVTSVRSGASRPPFGGSSASGNTCDSAARFKSMSTRA